MKNKGMIHVFYGSGNGKTSAAVGAALRMCGSGGRVVFAQFLKDGTSSELALLEQQPLLTLCCKPTACGFVYTMSKQQKEETVFRCRLQLQRAFEEAEEADLLVLDEVLEACAPELMGLQELLERIDSRPEKLEVILTGHQLPAELKERSDYITHMQSIRHPFEKGLTARKGIEY